MRRIRRARTRIAALTGEAAVEHGLSQRANLSSRRATLRVPSHGGPCAPRRSTSGGRARSASSTRTGDFPVPSGRSGGGTAGRDPAKAYQTPPPPGQHEDSKPRPETGRLGCIFTLSGPVAARTGAGAGFPLSAYAGTSPRCAPICCRPGSCDTGPSNSRARCGQVRPHGARVGRK
jgi:hypothetical protein